MTPDSPSKNEIPSTIPIDPHHAELLMQLLEDLDAFLRQPHVDPDLHTPTRHADPSEAGRLIDAIGFQALRMRQILAQHDAPGQRRPSP